MNISKPENVCPICNKVFSRKADCNRHRRLHDGIRPHICEVPGCGKRFAQYTALKTHLNVHTGEKPFRCGSPGCQATFGDPSSCARHRREIHNPRKPFKCPFPGCMSSILRLSSFRVHLKKHGLKPDDYMEFSKRSQSPVEASQSIEPGGFTGGQDASLYGSSYNQEAPLPGPSNADAWDSLLSSVDPLMPLVMLPEYTPEVSCSSPLLLASSSQFPLDYNHGYFLSPSSLGASSAASSRYSSPVASVMTPEMEPGFVSDVNIQQIHCSVPQQDWTGNGCWQAYGIPFVG